MLGKPGRKPIRGCKRGSRTITPKILPELRWNSWDQWCPNKVPQSTFRPQKLGFQIKMQTNVLRILILYYIYTQKLFWRNNFDFFFNSVAFFHFLLVFHLKSQGNRKMFWCCIIWKCLISINNLDRKLYSVLHRLTLLYSNKATS